MKPEKNITLLAISLIALSGFFLLPRNQEWMSQRVIPYYNDFLAQKNRLDLEVRKRERYKSAYIYSRQIADFFIAKKMNPQVLVPPSAYFKSRGINYSVPEPAVFYYYTGLKTISPNSRDAIKSNWVIRAENGRIVFDSVYDATILADTIKRFRKFPPL